MESATPVPPLLAAVFWDYPQYLDEKALREALKDCAEDFRRWVMLRFMRHGRVVDAFRFFSLAELERGVPLLRNDAYNTRKWTRIIEVYRGSERG